MPISREQLIDASVRRTVHCTLPNLRWLEHHMSGECGEECNMQIDPYFFRIRNAFLALEQEMSEIEQFQRTRAANWAAWRKAFRIGI